VGAFQEHFSIHAASALARQHEFRRLLGERSWGVDIDAGTVTYGDDLTFPIQLLGTEAYDDNTWLWAWANAESEFPPGLLRLVADVREYGKKHGLDELCDASTPLARVHGHLVSMLCGGIAGGLPYYRGPYEGGALFFLVLETPPEVTAPLSPERIPTIAMEVIQTFDVNHRVMFENFLLQQGFEVDRLQMEIAGIRPDGSSCLAKFDDQGRLAGVQFELKPRR